MYPHPIEDILNDSTKLLTERQRNIQHEIDWALRHTDEDSFVGAILAELIIRVNMIVKVTQEKVND